MWLHVVYTKTPFSSQAPLFTRIFSCIVLRDSSLRLHIATTVKSKTKTLTDRTLVITLGKKRTIGLLPGQLKQEQFTIQIRFFFENITGSDVRIPQQLPVR